MSLMISIANDFAPTPGPRLIEEGEYSGQLFREECLKPQYLKARESHAQLLIDLDNTEGYATSFLEEAFGGLARQFPGAEVAGTLLFKSDDEPYLIQEIKGYIQNARNR